MTKVAEKVLWKTKDGLVHCDGLYFRTLCGGYRTEAKRLETGRITCPDCIKVAG